MILRRFFATALLVLSAAQGAEKRAQPTRPGANPGGEAATAYKGAIVMNAATGDVVFEDRADMVAPPASMTKLMTFAVVHDALRNGTVRLDTPVRITVEDSKMGGTQVFLDPRETFTVEELIYAIMIQSANDASHALARATSGSVSAFVDAMNAKARLLGMTNTTFRTPHGLPPASRKTAEGDLTSPRDFARLSRHLVLQTDVLKYTAIRHRPFGEGKRSKPIAMSNHNHLLGKVDGVDGLKTGFTAGAGFCLSATAQRSGRRVIVIMMGSPQAKIRDLHVSELIERGFAAIPAATTPSVPPTPLPPTTAREESPIRPAPHPKTAAPEPAIKFSVPKR